MARVSVVVVTFESSLVLERCLAALPLATTRHTLDIWVVDNASTDGSADLASRLIPSSQVVRLADNRGFSAGVNAGLARATGDAIAVINPDAVVEPGAFDTLMDVLASTPAAGLVAPLVVHPSGTAETSVGRFPTAARERNHALWLDRTLGLEGRTCAFPETTGTVDWASGCAWLLRADAVRAVGPLDERYFMYFDDVDYCRRLWSAGWTVVATRAARVAHDAGHGSTRTSALAAEGGLSGAIYFEKHLSPHDATAARGWLLRGWRLRAVAHQVAAWLGRPTGSARAARYRQSLALARSAS